MKEVILYQTKSGCNYSFMNYGYAKDKLNMNDYEDVLHFMTNKDLEGIFTIGNNGELRRIYPDVRFRSISVSDIIEVNGTKYYVDSFGFKEIG